MPFSAVLLLLRHFQLLTGISFHVLYEPVGAFLCLPFDVGKISVAFAACERVCFVFFSKYKIGVSQFYRSVNCNTPINVFLLSVPFDLIGSFVSKAPQPLAFPVNQHIAFSLTLCCCTQMTGIPSQLQNFLIFNVYPFDFKNNRSCAVITAGNHDFVIIHPSSHDCSALECGINVPADSIPCL